MKTRLMTILCLACLFILCARVAHGALVTQYWGGGEVDIADNTDVPIGNFPALCGNWDATIKNWANKTNAPNTYAASQNGNEVVAYLRAHHPNSGISVISITVGTDVVVHQIRDEVTASGGFNQEFYVISNGPVSVRLEPTPDGQQPKLGGTTDRTRGVRYFIPLAGTNGFQFIGGRTYLRSASDGLTGPVILDGTMVNVYIDQIGSLKGVSEIALRSLEVFQYQPNVAGTLDRLNNELVIRGSSRAGNFRYNGQRHNTAPSSETIGTLLLDGHLPVSFADYSGSGTLFPRLHLAHGIDRGPTGKGTMSVALNVTAPHLRSAVIVSNPPATDVLLPWMITETGGFCKINASDLSIDLVPMTAAPDDLATWLADADYYLPPAFNPVNQLPTLAINSLGIYCSNRTVTLADGATLTVKSGGISYNTYGPTGIRVITNGYLTSGTDDLYLISSTSGAASDWHITSTIIGDINVIYAGNLLTQVRGNENNAYTGTTYVHGRLSLLKFGGAIAIPGDLVISRNGIVQFAAANQITPSANVTIREGGLLNHVDFAQTYSGVVTIEGGTFQIQFQSLLLNGAGYGLVFNGGTLLDSRGDGSNLNDLSTDVRYQSTATLQAQWTGVANTRWRLMGDRVFNIDNSAHLKDGVSEMIVSLPLEHNGLASLTKQGSGVLEFAAGVTHPYDGATTIEDGTLLVHGVVATSTVTVAGGALAGNGTVRNVVVQNGGTWAPGASIGVMTIPGNATLENGAELELEWNDGVTNDIVVVGGNFTAQGQPVIKVLNLGGTPAANTQVVLKVTGTYTGPVGGYQFDLPVWWTAVTDGGDLIDLGGGNYGIAFLPEPGVLGVLGLAAFAVRKRR